MGEAPLLHPGPQGKERATEIGRDRARDKSRGSERVTHREGACGGVRLRGIWRFLVAAVVKPQKVFKKNVWRAQKENQLEFKQQDIV